MELTADNDMDDQGPRWQVDLPGEQAPNDVVDQFDERRDDLQPQQQQVPATMREYVNDYGLEFYGINKRLYKRPEKNGKQQQPTFKTMTDYVFLPCSPDFEKLPEEFEAINVPKQCILEQSLKREVEEIIGAESHINRIVYDSKDPNPHTASIDPTSLGLDMLPYYLPQSRDDSVLVFESRFESGNLRRAIQVSDYDYNLILSTDFQTTAHTQWYYFSVANTRRNVQYRFKIVNMMKADSLYNVGMKPLLYSEKKAKQSTGKIGWHRSGTDICYYVTNMKRKNGNYYNALSFTLKFQYDNDCVYIAHCYPYTYTQLQKYLRGLESDPVLRNRFSRKTLCLTESGNSCDYLTIGENPNPTNSTAAAAKKVIFLTSRVHPGQTQVSYLIEYIIDFLLSNHPAARQLRDNFIFKIIPMLNVDGVINGNYRCNLFGADLNRQWIDPSRKAHPTIYYAKNLIKKIKEQRELLIYCDFHGHSRKKNVFIYGCSGKDPIRKEQVFPMLMKNNCSFFSFKDCCFNVQKDREGAARIALWKELNIINCFTLEISFCGSDFGKYQYLHFNLSLFKELAHSFCQSIYDLYEPDQANYRQALEQVETVLKTAKYDDKKDNDSDDSDFSGDDVKEPPANFNNSNGADRPAEGSLSKGNDPKKSLEGRQHNSLPHTDANKVIIKKKPPLALPAKKKK